METFDLATSNRMDMTKKYVLSYIDIMPMSIKYRLIIKVALFCFSILIGLSSCSLNSSSEEPYLTPEIAINQLAELSPTEGAQFFVNNRAQVRKSVDSPPDMLTEDHHHTVHEERQVCSASHLRPKSLHL